MKCGRVDEIFFKFVGLVIYREVYRIPIRIGYEIIGRVSHYTVAVFWINQYTKIWLVYSIKGHWHWWRDKCHLSKCRYKLVVQLRTCQTIGMLYSSLASCHHIVQHTCRIYYDTYLWLLQQDSRSYYVCS